MLKIFDHKNLALLIVAFCAGCAALLWIGYLNGNLDNKSETANMIRFAVYMLPVGALSLWGLRKHQVRCSATLLTRHLQHYVLDLGLMPDEARRELRKNELSQSRLLRNHLKNLAHAWYGGTELDEQHETLKLLSFREFGTSKDWAERKAV